MRFELKPISRKAVPEAMQKAKRYRLINEPALAESICLDVLRADPENQDALITLLLAITDQFRDGGSAERARELLPLLQNEYCREYYSGVVWERAALALLRRGDPGAERQCYEGLRKAMTYFERAERIRPSGNDDAILRWNTCARVLMKDATLRVQSDSLPVGWNGE